MPPPTFRALLARVSPISSHSFLSTAPPSLMYTSAIQSCVKAAAAAPLSSHSSSFLPVMSSRSIHTTSPNLAKKKKRKGKGKGEEPDARIVNLKSSMPRKVPAPLRFARNRALRHWTIHRAWLLYQRKERTREEHELERMFQSMHNACEELRKTSGPGTRDEGYLYRVAMEKKGLYGHNNIPIEYARPQTETPAREPWNHGWTR
ncbi:hypothetical protein F5X99DRAFT_90509 [Biscogniauxia marginata]|nr:hypothetical protein F5X99DRAFT_90509 [Biscogniauxia marginata]